MPNKNGNLMSRDQLQGLIARLKGLETFLRLESISKDADVIRDAILALSSASPSWQPIATAPTDGTRMLLYGCEFKRHWFGCGYYFRGVPGDGSGWIAHSFYTMPKNDSSGVFNPTHWMPLPAPPQAETEQP